MLVSIVTAFETFVAFCESVVERDSDLANQQAGWSHPASHLLNPVALQIFNVAFLCRQPHSLHPHDLIFIASTPKLSPRPALVFAYSSPSFKASKGPLSRIAASGYVSVSALSFANDFRGVSSKLHLLP